MTPLSNIKMLALDIDGVLTDGHLTWGGETVGWTQRFYVRDGEAIRQAITSKLVVVTAISRNKTPCAKARMKHLGIATTHVGISDKVQSLEAVCREFNVRPEEVCYVGDGAEDVPILQQVGFGVAPADGHPMAQQASHRVTQSVGGRGVAEEVIGWLSAARQAPTA